MADKRIPRTRASSAGSRDAAASDRTNRRLWNRQSAAYDRRHRRSLSRSGGMSWGLWRIPERRLRLLGEVRGKDILELGCGAARWSLALARRGARPVGIDLSEAQLVAARRVQRAARNRFPLVQGSVRRLPFRDESFDIAFCDWGALTFADPLETIPEASRVLRPGGQLVFTNSSPWRSVAQSRVRYVTGRRLRYPYFDLHRIEYPREVNYQLPYGRWVELFRRSGLVIERLLELPTPPGARSTYLTRQEQLFGGSWPLETIWVLSKWVQGRRG